MNTIQQRMWIEKILRALAAWQEPLMKTEVVLLVRESNDSYLIGVMDGLCFGGYINFDHSDTDTRITWVTLAPRGQEYLSQLDEIPF